MEKLTTERNTESSAVVAQMSKLVGLRHAARGLHLAPTSEVQAPRAGPNPSAFRGRGIEFDEVRAYHPGDDIRHIDWRVTARTGSVYSKVFQEERERPVWLLVDAGATARFGTRRCFKSVAAAEAAALVAWAAHLQGDRIGGIALAPSDVRVLTPRVGEGSLFELLNAFSRATEREIAPISGNGLAEALGRLHERVRPGSRIVVFSDFYGLDEHVERLLGEIRRRSDLTCVLVYDPLEQAAPPPGRYRVSDGEHIRAFSSQDGEWREAYEATFAVRRERLATGCRPNGIGMLDLATPDDPAIALAPILDPRHTNRRHRRAA